MKIKNSMTPDFIQVHQTDQLWTLIDAILANNQDTTPVVDQTGRLVGIVSTHDIFDRIMPSYLDMDEKLMEVMHSGYLEEHFPAIAHLTAGDLMCTVVDKVQPEEGVIRAVALIVQHHHRSLPVVDDQGRLLGMINRKSILQRLKTKIECNEV